MHSRYLLSDCPADAAIALSVAVASVLALGFGASAVDFNLNLPTPPPRSLPPLPRRERTRPTAFVACTSNCRGRVGFGFLVVSEHFQRTERLVLANADGVGAFVCLAATAEPQVFQLRSSSKRLFLPRA